MKYKKTLSFIVVLAMVFSLMQTFSIFSSAEVNAKGSLETDWEKYLKVELPTDKKLQTYCEHTKIYADNGVSLPENERFYVYKIHTWLGNSASFIPLTLERRIEKSYREVMKEDIQVTILSGYEEVLAKYRGVGDKTAASGKFLLQIQRGVDQCEVEVEIVVHKDLSLSETGETKWMEFLESERWYGDAEFSRYIGRDRTLVTEENGVALPEDQQYYTYRLYSSFSSIELFTKSQLHYRLNWTSNWNGCSCLIVDGYEEAYAKLSQMENGGSSTDTYKILINGEYVAEIKITISVGTNFSNGRFFWDEVLENMPTDPAESIYAEHTKITHDESGELKEPITVHKLHVTLGHSESVTAEKLEDIISSLFMEYSPRIHIAKPPIKIISGVENAVSKYQGIGDNQAATQTFRFIYTFTPRSLPSYYRQFEYGIEAEIVIHKDLSIDEEARNTLSENWKKYVEVSLPQIAKTSRTYGEAAWIEADNNKPLPKKDRFFVYKIHTSFGRSASFTKENLETLLEESYAKTMNDKVDIQILDGFESAKEKFSQEGDHGSATQRFTLQIRANGTGITESVDIVIHKDIGLELCLPGDWEVFKEFVEPIPLTCRENASFTKELVAEVLEEEYQRWMDENVTITVDDLSKAFAEYRKLADGTTMEYSIPVTIQRKNNSYSAEILFAVTKDLSRCTGYVKGVCPACGTKLGDINEDGILDKTDFELMMNIVLGNISPESNIQLADINQDGSIDSLDVVLLDRLISGLNIWG